MGKTRPYIKKGEGKRFDLVHRRGEDSSTGERESVLILTENRNDHARRIKSMKMDDLLKSSDHVNLLGFNNDGYDYSQHFRQMGGGGRYISADGSSFDLEYEEPQSIDINELFPKEGLSLKDSCLTISEEVMDEDLKAALFNEEDDDGVFEELDDDFVFQVMADPTVEDQDFENHARELIQQSEELVLLANERAQRNIGAAPWETASKSSKKGSKGLLSGIDEDLVDFDGYDGVDLDDDEVDDDEDDDEPVYELNEQDREIMEKQFEKVLEEYDSDEIGELDEDDREGEFDYDDDQLLSAMDEFIKDHADEYNPIQVKIKNHLLAQQRSLPKNIRDHSNDDESNNLEEEEEEVEEDEDDQEGVKAKKTSKKSISTSSTTSTSTSTSQIVWSKEDYERNAREQQVHQHEAEATVQLLDDEEGDEAKIQQTLVEVIERMGYSAQKKEEKWDCESVLSTYSTTDNHPSIIKASSSKFRPYKSRFSMRSHAMEEKKKERLDLTEQQLQLEKLRLDGGSGGNNSMNASMATAAMDSSSSSSSSSYPQIRLKGKLNLPEGFHSLYAMKMNGQDQPEKSSSKMMVDSSSTLKSTSRTKSNNNRYTNDSNDESDEESMEEEEEEEEDGGDGNDDRDNKNRLIRNKNETAEEKKARKKLQKEAQREKRANKKALKNAFKTENSKRNKQASGSTSEIAGVAVFRY